MKEEIRQLIPQLAVLIRYYKKTYYLGGGGSLHIIIDDGNFDAVDINFCREECFALQDVLGMLVCDVMSEMNEDDLKTQFYAGEWEIKKTDL